MPPKGWKSINVKEDTYERFRELYNELGQPENATYDEFLLAILTAITHDEGIREAIAMALRLLRKHREALRNRNGRSIT